MSDLSARLAALVSLSEAEALYPSRTLPPGAEVTRLAPSPTGMPHIGTAMQAVIDRALADKGHGLFILRVEDTDKARSVPGAEEAIVESLRWLGTVPDEGPYGFGGAYGPYTQSERLPLYRLAADYLVQQGHAYHCFCSSQRLEELREAQTKAKMMPKYDRHCRALTAEEVAARHQRGEASVVRMKVPKDGTKITFRDEVRGEIAFDAKVLDDSILLKSDGFPTYHLAVIVDDHFMRVTLVVRGEEWISSTPKHVLLYQAFGWTPPKFLHTVLLRDEQRRKLSKRSGDTSIAGFRAQGYLPEGFRNFLTRVMWAHPDNKDIYDLPEFARLVTAEALPSTGPVADMKLFGFINGQYLSRRTPSELRQAFLAYLDYLITTERVPDLDDDETAEPTLTLDTVRALRTDIQAHQAYTEQVFALEPERHQKFADIFRNCGFFFDATFREASDALLAKHAPDRAKAASILRAVADTTLTLTDHDVWDKTMRGIAAAHEVKDKVVFMLTRVAVTGSERTPPLLEIAHILGEGRLRQRVDAFIQRLGG